LKQDQTNKGSHKELGTKKLSRVPLNHLLI